MLESLASFGTGSIQTLWVPLGVWTLLWAMVEGLLWLLRDTHPGIRYRLTQAGLAALPLSLALAAWMPTDWMPPEWALSHWIPLQPTTPDESTVVLGQPVMDATEVASPLLVQGPDLVLVGLGVGTCVVFAMALFSLVRLGLQAVAVLQLRRAIPGVFDPKFETTAHRIASSLGIAGAADIALTTADIVPMTLGIRRPLVVIPAHLSPADRRSALLHELVHVRSHDPLAQAIEAGITAVFSAHPAAHRLARQCELLREMACDAAVLDHRGVNRRSYAALVSSFATPTAVRALPATVGMASPVFHVHHRLSAMSTPRPLPSRLATWSPAFAVLLVAALLVTAGSALAQTPTEEIEEVVEQPTAVTVQGVLIDSLRIRALKEEIEALSAQSNRFVHEPEVEERELPLREIEEHNVRVGVLRERLDTLQDSERQLEGNVSRARVLKEELEAIASYNRFTRRHAGADSIVAVGNVRLRTTSDGIQLNADRIRVLTEQLEALRGTSVLRGQVSRPELIEEESPVDAIVTEGLSLGDVYPNPAQDMVIINVSVSEASDVTVGLFDLTGRRLVTRSLRLDPGAHKVEVDTRELATGTYVSRVTAKSNGATAQATNRVTIVR